MTATRYLLVRAGTILALPIHGVESIIPYVELSAPPTTGGLVAGIANVGGAAVMVLRTGALLGIEVPPPGIHAHIVRLRHRHPPVALLVERVFAIHDAAKVELAPLSDGTTFNGCVTAELTAGDGTVAHLLDVDALLTAEERQRLAAFAAIEQARLAELEEQP